VRESASLLASYGMSGLIQYLGINLEIVKTGIGAYLCPFLALLSLLLMGIKKKAPEPRYEASPYPARRTGAQQSRPAQKTAQAWQEMSKELGTSTDPAPRPSQSTAARPNQNAASRPSQNAAPRPNQNAAPAAAAASIQAGRVPLPGEQSWTCAYCGRRMEADKNFCDLCGSTRPKRREAIYCSACGAKLRPDARFCSNCGRSVMTEERSGGAAAEDQRETQERRP
jgi:RNA polymerase subunit RPABC4/transcription elongation factor Spt4